MAPITFYQCPLQLWGPNDFAPSYCLPAFTALYDRLEDISGLWTLQGGKRVRIGAGRWGGWLRWSANLFWCHWEYDWGSWLVEEHSQPWLSAFIGHDILYGLMYLRVLNRHITENVVRLGYVVRLLLGTNQRRRKPDLSKLAIRSKSCSHVESPKSAV